MRPPYVSGVTALLPTMAAIHAIADNPAGIEYIGGYGFTYMPPQCLLYALVPTIRFPNAVVLPPFYCATQTG